MRLTAGMLREIIKEEVTKVRRARLREAGTNPDFVSGDLEMSRDKAEKWLQNCDPEQVLVQDIVDPETGEVYAHAGETCEMARQFLAPPTPDEALDALKELAANEIGAGEDLGTAIDIAKGFKLDNLAIWKEALKSSVIKNMYYDPDMNFENIDDTLAYYLAET